MGNGPGPTGLHAWPTAQARHYGLSFPCRAGPKSLAKMVCRASLKPTNAKTEWEPQRKREGEAAGGGGGCQRLLAPKQQQHHLPSSSSKPDASLEVGDRAGAVEEEAAGGVGVNR